MKTLAELKRDLPIGSGLKFIGGYCLTDRQKTRVGIVRYVISKNTMGVCLGENKADTKGSELRFPKASLLEYDGSTIKIYQSGNRPLTDTEKRILDSKPQDKKQSEIDMMTDGSTMFYREKKYFMTVEGGKYLYLWGLDRHCGKKLMHNRETDGPMIDDDDCKGELSLEYEIV